MSIPALIVTAIVGLDLLLIAVLAVTDQLDRWRDRARPMGTLYELPVRDKYPWTP